MILNKPGRLTPDEFEKMKQHSDAGHKIIDNMMHTVDEADAGYLAQAEDMAHYHHEKWNGEGYPEGLKGEQIPLSARIMAVADVYDALVSKRVYKDSLSFEKSAAIMCEGMGTQFDPRLKPVFLGCREELEQYYQQHGR